MNGNHGTCCRRRSITKANVDDPTLWGNQVK